MAEKKSLYVNGKSFTVTVDDGDAPETIDIVLIDHPDELPLGAGEPATRPVAAAIANAVFDATGIRLRQAPLSAERLKAALLQAAGRPPT